MTMSGVDVPYVVVLSGSVHPGSRTERIARWAGGQLAHRGASTSVLTGADLDFPFYRPGIRRAEPVLRFLRAMESCDGVVLVSPSYHGTVTGLLKNTLDYINDLGQRDRPYLDGRAIGCVALADGEQGAVSTLHTLRVIAHALRGWPTPLGVTVTAASGELAGDEAPVGDRARGQFHVLFGQVLTLAGVHRGTVGREVCDGTGPWAGNRATRRYGGGAAAVDSVSFGVSSAGRAVTAAATYPSGGFDG